MRLPSRAFGEVGTVVFAAESVPLRELGSRGVSRYCGWRVAPVVFAAAGGR